MNKGAKKELMFLLGLVGAAAFISRQKKLSWTCMAANLVLALSLQKKEHTFMGKTVMITGGSRGLGLALAQKLLNEGAFVSLLARDEVELDRAQKILSTQFSAGQIQICVCDVTDLIQFRRALRTTIDLWGDLDMLINNAGAILVGPFDSMTPQDFKAQLDIHLHANVQNIKEILPIFRERGEGRIVNVCSMGGKVAVPHMIPYDVSKFALAGLSQGLAAELAEENISVTTVYPTLIRTGSPIQAVFKGDSYKEFSWFATADIFPGLSKSAEEVAHQIIEAARERQSELVPSMLGKLRLAAGVFFPELMLWTFSMMNRVMPKDTSLEYKTGAQSKTSDTYLTAGLLRRAEHAELLHNQIPKTDAKFNLGLRS